MTNRLVNYNILGKEMKRFIILSVTILIVFGLFSCKNIHRYGCASRDRYTDEEHYERVRKKVIERYIESGLFDSCEIYPIYDFQDRLSYFLLEFAPSAYGYVMICESDTSCIYGAEMYIIDRKLRFDNGKTWQRYTIIDDEVIYEKDSEGNDILYHSSPFKINNVLNEKLYLLYVTTNIPIQNDGYIPAVKKDGKFLNLVSMKEVSIIEDAQKGQFEFEDIYFIPSNSFNL